MVGQLFHLKLQRKESPKEEMNGWKCLPSRKARVVAMERTGKKRGRKTFAVVAIWRREKNPPLLRAL